MATYVLHKSVVKLLPHNVRKVEHIHVIIHVHTCILDMYMYMYIQGKYTLPEATIKTQMDNLEEKNSQHIHTSI